MEKEGEGGRIPVQVPCGEAAVYNHEARVASAAAHRFKRTIAGDARSPRLSIAMRHAVTGSTIVEKRLSFMTATSRGGGG